MVSVECAARTRSAEETRTKASGTGFSRGERSELVLPNAQTVVDILGLSPAEAGAVVDGLIRRKKEMFVDDERLVVSVHAFREGEMLRILAASAW